MLFVIWTYNPTRYSYTETRRFHSRKSIAEIMRSMPNAHAERVEIIDNRREHWIFTDKEDQPCG